jgi:hypothetical protein
MPIWRLALACVALSLATGAAPARAGDWNWYDGPAESWYSSRYDWRATHATIYELQHRIALLEANPYIDDGYKGPIITGAHRDALRLRSTLPPPQWMWASPCCYSRRPIHIR